MRRPPFRPPRRGRPYPPHPPPPAPPPPPPPPAPFSFKVLIFTFTPKSCITLARAQARRAVCLSRLVAEHDGRPAPILFHCFSNTGWLAYCGLLADLEARRPDVLARVAGAVVDSAPHAAPCPTVFAAGFMTALSRGAAPDPRSRKFRAARAFFQAWLQGPRKRELKSVVRSEARLANYPQLYVYSDDDHVIPPASVESAAATHAAAGRQVSLLRLTNSVHVAHLRHHRAAYLAALDAFLESAGLAAAPAAPAKAAAGLALSAVCGGVGVETVVEAAAVEEPAWPALAAACCPAPPPHPATPSPRRARPAASPLPKTVALLRVGSMKGSAGAGLARSGSLALPKAPAALGGGSGPLGGRAAIHRTASIPAALAAEPSSPMVSLASGLAAVMRF